MMRITTNMIRRNYQNNLNSTLSGLEQARRQAETGRRFSKSYEDPSAAAKATILENRYARNGDYRNAVEDTMKWQDTQEDVLMQLGKIAKEVNKNYGVEAFSGTNASVRDTYAATFREMQKSMVYALNTKYGDTFAMAGSDGQNAPFELKEDGTVTYRGLDVNDPANTDALKALAREHSYIDLGFGLTFDGGGEIVSSSAFDAAFPGIKAVGFGQSDDGMSNNMIVLMGQMADVLEADNFDEAAYKKLWTQFDKGAGDLQNCLTEIGTKTSLLSSTKDRLENEKLNITTQFDSTVNINEAEALMNFSYAQYVYNVALKIGTSLLSNSLLDFMK
ncbi:hypothetical protein LIZ64_13405 [[Clostridium] hylemonae]|uniref:flagellin N-terminal helical domain-containing protein n=3 Tax=[Clostridium] hylemonae TaxID=89153 RepID=UPI003060B982|nr:hypothetical protein [[Clostridium] hylemonae]